MRSVLAIGSFIAVVSAAMAVLKVGDAAAQAPPIVAAPPSHNPYLAGSSYLVAQQAEVVDRESQEMARLQGAEAGFGHEVETLGRQLSDAADEKQRTDIKYKLQEALAQQLDAQQQIRELEVTRIEAKLMKLRDFIAKRNDARRMIIDRRFEQLLREAEGLGWNSPTTGPQLYGSAYLPQPGGHYMPVRSPDLIPSPPSPRRK